MKLTGIYVKVISKCVVKFATHLFTASDPTVVLKHDIPGKWQILLTSGNTILFAETVQYACFERNLRHAFLSMQLLAIEGSSLKALL